MPYITTKHLEIEDNNNNKNNALLSTQEMLVPQPWGPLAEH